MCRPDFPWAEVGLGVLSNEPRWHPQVWRPRCPRWRWGRPGRDQADLDSGSQDVIHSWVMPVLPPLIYTRITSPQFGLFKIIPRGTILTVIFHRAIPNAVIHQTLFDRCVILGQTRVLLIKLNRVAHATQEETHSGWHGCGKALLNESPFVLIPALSRHVYLEVDPRHPPLIQQWVKDHVPGLSYLETRHDITNRLVWRKDLGHCYPVFTQG